MRKMKLALAIASACALLVGCAAPRSVMDQGWTQKPAKVKVVFTEPFIANPDDLQDDLPEYVNNFSDWYKAQLETNLGSQTNGVLYSVEKVSMDKVKFEAAAVNGVNIKVPKSLIVQPDIAQFNKTSLEARDIKIKITKIDIPVAFASAFEGEIIRRGDTYYDAKTGKRLGYGDFEAKSGYTFAVSLSDWQKVVQKTVSSVLDNTPIKK